jgi:hypothetical protein
MVSIYFWLLSIGGSMLWPISGNRLQKRRNVHADDSSIGRRAVHGTFASRYPLRLLDYHLLTRFLHGGDKEEVRKEASYGRFLLGQENCVDQTEQGVFFLFA